MRRSRNNTTQISRGGVICTSPIDIKVAVVSYFSNLFRKADSIKASMGPEGFNTLSSAQFCEMGQNITMVEVRQAMWNCECRRLKGTGSWWIHIYPLQESVVVDHRGRNFWYDYRILLRHGKLLKGINTSHVALIQKSKATNYSFSECIPISLVHGFYKIIGKCYPPGW